MLRFVSPPRMICNAPFVNWSALDATNTFVLIFLGVLLQAAIKPKNINVAEMSRNLKKMNDFMNRFVEICPPFIFLAAIPQLTSRICHSHMGKLLPHFEILFLFPLEPFWTVIFRLTALKLCYSKQTGFLPQVWSIIDIGVITLF